MAEGRLTVAVAGGTGFVGSAIVRELKGRGHRVVVLTHRPEAARRTGPSGASEIRAADITSPATLPAALSEVDALVIALAFPNLPIEAPRRGWTFDRIDAGGTEALVAAARTAGVRRLVYISGAGAAPDADRHWFRAKWRAEEAVRGSGIAYTIFRPSWVFGPADRSLNRFVRMSRWLPFIPQIGDGSQVVVPVFVADLAGLVADALASDAAVNAVVEVGGPETLSMDDVIRTALDVIHRRRPILHFPKGAMKLAVRPLTLLPVPPMTPDAVDFITASAPVDTTELQRLLPRRLTPLREALETYLGRTV